MSRPSETLVMTSSYLDDTREPRNLYFSTVNCSRASFFLLNYFNPGSLTGFVFPTFVTSNFPGYHLIGVRPSMIQSQWGRAGIQ